MTSEREQEIKNALYLVANDKFYMVEELLAAIDELRAERDFEKEQSRIYEMRIDELMAENENLRELLKKHKHDSYSHDYYGIPCEICQALAQDDEMEKKG